MSETTAPQISVESRILGVTDSIFAVLSDGTALRAFLKPDAPVLGAATTDGGWHMAPLAVAVAHYGNSPSFGLWVVCRAVAALEYDLARAPSAASAAAASRDIDNLLVAMHTLRAGLKAPPPFGEMIDGAWCAAPLSVGEARYGAVPPLLAVWRMCRAADVLSFGWTGAVGPAVEPAGAQPDEAPGLEVAAPASADVDADQQTRLGGV